MLKKGDLLELYQKQLFESFDVDAFIVYEKDVLFYGPDFRNLRILRRTQYGY